MRKSTIFPLPTLGKKSLGHLLIGISLVIGFWLAPRSLGVVGALFIPNAQAAVSTDSLVGYWKFDEGTGTLAADSSGHSNNGTLTNGPTWSASPTNDISFTNPYALSFDGTDDYVTAADLSSLDVTSGITLSAWIKPDSFPEYAAVAGKFSPGATGYTLDVDDGGGNARFWVNAGGDKIAQFPNSQISTSSWSLLTGTYDGSNVKI